MLEAKDRVPTMVCWAVRSYGYTVAVLDQEGQILWEYDGDPGNDSETKKFARETAKTIARENGIPISNKTVFQHQEIMPTTKEVREIP